jgi:XTP/dITP diphosphohydrolase
VTQRIIVLVTSPRLPAGLLTADAWDAVRAHPVLTAAPGPLADAVRAAGGEVTEVEAETALARLRESEGPVVWLAGTADPVTEELANRLASNSEDDVEVLYGSWDPPGARLLDVAAVMDRLRSPGGCPWDAEQTHESLRQYLLEEAYEAYDALLDEDLDALREELGDVLLQIAFHARIASEEEGGFDIDDVAGELVAKLVRRHPHVFAETAVSGADEVNANWDAIKKAEKQRESALDGVARSQPALALAAKFLSRAERAGVPVERPGLTDELSVPASEEELGGLLFALVAAATEKGLDPEAALRSAANRYAAAVRAAERKPAGQGRADGNLATS